MIGKWREFVAFFSGLPRGRRVALTSVVAGLTALVLIVASWVQRPLSPPPLDGGVADVPQRLDQRGAPSAVLAYQTSIERELADRIEGLLGAVVGHDHALARVAATLDFARVERVEESYDPDRTVLRRQRTRRERTTEPRDAVTERRDDSESYDVSKVVSRTVAPVGALKRISVAVLVDGAFVEREGKRVFAPRPPEELDRLRELVKGAVGFSEARGDRIQIASVPFQRDTAAAAARVLSAVARWGPAFLPRLLAVGFAAAMLVYVVRPVVIALGARPGTAAGAALPAVGANERVTQETLALVRQHPERAAQLVREWLHESAPGLEPRR